MSHFLLDSRSPATDSIPVAGSNVDDGHEVDHHDDASYSATAAVAAENAYGLVHLVGANDHDLIMIPLLKG